MLILLAIAVAAVGIATLLVALSFGKRTEKHVSAMLDRLRDSGALNNETAINELRAELHECLARLDWLTSGVPAVPEATSSSQMAGYEADSPADGLGPDPWGDGQG
jgi:hypothetical protein